MAANSNAMAIYIGALWPWFGIDPGRAVVIVGVCGGLTLVNVLGVKDGVRTLAFFTFFKLIPLLIMILLGLQYVSPDVLFPENMPTIDDLGGTTLLLIYAFVGFETVLITAGETAKPKITIPKALILTMIATGVLYFLIVLVYLSVLPGEVTEGATLVDVGRRLAGPVGAIAITLAAIFSIGGNLSSIMLAVPRLTFSLAEHRLMPPWFGHVHEKYSSPANSIIFPRRPGDGSRAYGLVRPSRNRRFIDAADHLYRLYRGTACHKRTGGHRDYCASISTQRRLYDSVHRLLPVLVGDITLVAGFMETGWSSARRGPGALLAGANAHQEAAGRLAGC